MDHKVSLRSWALLLCVAMLVIMLPWISTTAFAAGALTASNGVTLSDTDGDGYYEIGDADALYGFAALVNAGNSTIDAELTADITVNGAVLQDGGALISDTSALRPWTPIAKYDSVYSTLEYCGTFDGQGHTISGIYFNDTTSFAAGLFGYVGQGGVIRNVTLVDSYFRGQQMVGSLLGNGGGITISNCASSATVANDTTDRVAGSDNDQYSLGGLIGVGNSEGAMIGCSFSGLVDGTNGRIGGLAGAFEGTVEDCYNLGQIYADYGMESMIGGLIGQAHYATVNDGYSACFGTGSGVVGGIIGRKNHGSVTNCYYASTSFFQRGIGLDQDGAAVEDGEGTVVGKREDQFASGEVAYLLGEGFGQKLGIDAYPVLGGDAVKKCTDCTGRVFYSNTQEGSLPHEYQNGFCGLCGGLQSAVQVTADNAGALGLSDSYIGYYAIENAGQLYWFAQKVNGGDSSCNVVLVADIVDNAQVLDGGALISDTSALRPWTPIAKYDSVYSTLEYCGTFDGQGHTISGIYFNDTTSFAAGLFGYVGQGGVIRNVTLVDSYFRGQQMVGSLLGNGGGITVSNCASSATVANDTTDRVAGSDNDQYSLGGLIGVGNSEVAMIGCSFSGLVDGTNGRIGGLAGAFEGTVEDCYNLGQIYADYGMESTIGGLIGQAHYATVNDGYSACFGTGSGVVGGIIGRKNHGSVTNCYYASTSFFQHGIGLDQDGAAVEDADGTVVGKREDQFASGEVAYLLGEGFGQKLGTDAFPVLKGEKVYQRTNCKSETVYSNTDGDGPHSFGDDDVCDLCGKVDGVPVLTVKYPSLSFEAEVVYNVYFVAEDIDDVVQMGLATFDTEETDGTVADAAEVIPGFVTDGSMWMVSTNGISAKEMGDTVNFRVYAQLSDGSYVYSEMKSYSAVDYAQTILSRSTSSQHMKSLVVAMLNYGAQAQLFFDYHTDALMNASLTADQQALVDTYDETMVDPVVAVDSAKAGSFVYDGTSFVRRAPTVSFDGAFAINYYFTPAKVPDDGMTLYYWSIDDYDAAATLTADNATGSMEMVAMGDANQFWGQVPGIAAKELDRTVFVAGVYEHDGVTYSTGILNYSIGKYCAGLAAKDGSVQQAFAQATAVYGYCAKEYFASL